MIGLSDRQRRFVAAYAGNALEAARAAGYKGSDAVLKVTGHRLFHNTKVQAALRARGEQIAKAAVERGELAPLSPDEHLRILAELARADTVDAKDRIRAIEVSAKMLGLLARREAASDGVATQVITVVDNGRAGSVPNG